jgi:hypothetical protein
VTINPIPYLHAGEVAEIMVCVSGATESLAVKLTLLNDGDVEFLDDGQNVGKPIDTGDGQPRPIHDFFDGVSERIVKCTNIKDDFVTSEPVRIRARRAAVVRLKVESPNDLFPQEEIQGERKPQPARWPMATRTLRLVDPKDIPPLIPAPLELPEAPAPVVPVAMADDEDDFLEDPTPAGVQLRPPSTDLCQNDPVWTLDTLVPEEELDTDDVPPVDGSIEEREPELPVAPVFPQDERPLPHLMMDLAERDDGSTPVNSGAGAPEELSAPEEDLPELEESPLPEGARPGRPTFEARLADVHERKRARDMDLEPPPKRRWWPILLLLTVSVVLLFIVVGVFTQSISHPQVTEGLVMNDLTSPKMDLENHIEHPDMSAPPDGSAVAVKTQDSATPEDTGAAEAVISPSEPEPEDLGDELLGEEPEDPIIAPYVERSCTNPTLLPGGPEADTCFIMGCQEGHSAAWKQVRREDGGLNWATCERYPTESADGTCTQVTNSDGVSTTSKFDTTKNEWLKSHPCSI